MLTIFTRLLYDDFASERDRQQWVTHSYQVISATRALLSNLQDAETGQRGYLLTGDESYREPFDSALREQQSIRQTLRQLTAGDTAQQATLDTVDRLVEEKFQELQKTMRSAPAREWTLHWPWFAPARASGSWTNAAPCCAPWKKGTGFCWRNGLRRPTRKTSERAGSWSWAAAALWCCW